MKILNKRVAVLTNDAVTAEQVGDSLAGIMETDIYDSEWALHNAMLKGHPYEAVIADAELDSPHGIPLHKTLIMLGHGHIPFIILVNQINHRQKISAVQEGVSEIFEKPLLKNALRIRIPFLAENYTYTRKEINTPVEFKLPLIKRIFDITFSFIALLLLSPLFLIVAVLIRLESRGPAFYYSLRVGTGYKIFRFYKFRSMITGAEAKLKDLSHLNQYNVTAAQSSIVNESDVKQLCDTCQKAGTACRSPLFADNKMLCEFLHKQKQVKEGDAAFIKIKDDPRITRIGKFIRNTSIDELPQLWNVFIGDMSMVGNRPLPLYEAEKITTDKFALRFMAPAGITGLWQVEKRGRGEMSQEERLNLDNNYAKTHSIVNDIKLILRTIPAIFQLESV